MGKFRVKPTRAVAKPFRSKFKKYELPAPSSTQSALLNSDFTIEKLKPVSILTSTLGQGHGVASDGKISKKSKSRFKRQKKSVSFSSNLTQVLSKDSIQEIIKSAKDTSSPTKSALVNFIHPGQGQGQLGINFKETGIRRTISNLINMTGLKDQGLKTDLGGIGNKNLKKIMKKELKDKKMRRRVKKHIFQNKLAQRKAADEELKARKKREETVIVGDLLPLSKILEELEEPEPTLKQIENAETVVPLKRKKTSAKKRRQELLDGIKFMETVMEMGRF